LSHGWALLRRLRTFRSWRNATDRIRGPVTVAGIGDPEVGAVRALQVYNRAPIAQQELPVRSAIAAAPAFLTPGADLRVYSRPRTTAGKPENAQLLWPSPSVSTSAA
jgi:hypothetical protein